MAYRIVKEKGAIKKVVLKVNDGKWQTLSPEMTAALGGYAKGMRWNLSEHPSERVNHV